MAESERQQEVAATVPVEIFGVPYSLREDGTVNADRLRVLAARVDRKMREVADQAPDLEPNQIAVLAALNLANEAGNGSEEADDERYQDLMERVSSLTSELEAALDA